MIASLNVGQKKSMTFQATLPSFFLEEINGAPALDVYMRIITSQNKEIDQKHNVHSPIGPLTFGEISSMPGNYVELHNKTAVVGLIEDD